MDTTYDVFLSYTWADRDAVEQLARALRDHGLAVFTDKPEIDDFARITTTITQALANSTVLLAWYSTAYPTRRACQWELTAAYLAAQREGDPSRRILVVNPEPTADHLHPGELRDALFRRAPVQGHQEALAGLARAVAGHVHGLEGTLGEVAPLVPVHWLPTQGLGSTRFVGRLPDMWKIHSALHPQTTLLTVGRTGPAVAQIRGLGGIGKSLLAEEYALRFGAAYPGGVFWLRASESHDQTDPPPEKLGARRHDEISGIADLLGITSAQLTLNQVTHAVAQRIQQRNLPCLWVVDDLPDGLDGQQVRSWLAPDPLAATLFTTRSQTYGALADPIPLDVLAEQEAIELLTTRRPPTSETEMQAASGIVAALGRHALAVDVAGAALAIQEGLVSYADFLNRLAEPDEDELEVIVELADALPNGHEASITRTLLHSINQLAEAGRDFLRLATSLAPAPIPADLVAAVFQETDALDANLAIRQAGRAIKQAADLSLATKTAADDQVGMWSVHPLVARTIRYRRLDPRRRAALRQAAIIVLTKRLQAAVDARAHVTVQIVMPHARELAVGAGNADEANLLGQVAAYDYKRGDFRPAELGYRQLWDTCRRLLGPEDPATLTAMSNLATTLAALGELRAARDLHQQILNTRRRLLGPDHPDTLASMSNLATTLYDFGDRAAARDLHQQALNTRRRLLGPDHPDTLASMSNLATTLAALGKLRGVGDLQQQTVDAYRRLLGPDHPSTLTAMSNLAATLLALGELTAARDLQQQTVELRRRTLGRDHPDTLRTTSNLAATLHDLGDLTGARDLQQQILDTSQRLLGPDHPDTLTAMNNLALTLAALGDRTIARDLQQQSVDAYRRLLGRDHPSTLTAMSNLAATLQALGNPAAARDLHQQILNTRRRLLGPDHPDTLASMSNLAATLHDIGDLNAARDLHQLAVDTSQRVLGSDHPTSLTLMGNLAATLHALGEMADAQQLLGQIANTHRRLLGPDHPSTKLVEAYLASIMQAQGSPEQRQPPQP